MKKLICCLATLAVAFGALSALTFVKASAATTPAFKGVSVSLNENIVLKFEVENYTTDYTLTFDYKGAQYSGEVKSGVAEFAYVTPQYLGKTVTATIYDGEKKEVTHTSKSVKDYLYELIRANKTAYETMPCEQFAAMKQLAVDMLNYGAAAQTKYLNATAEELVTAGLTTEEKALATPFAAPASTAQATLSGTKAGYEWVSAGIRFDYNVSLYFVIKPLTENAVLKLKINDNEVIDKFIKENGNYKFRYENVNVVDFANKYTVKVLDEAGNAIGQTLSYSVNTYVFNMHANAEMSAITKAVYNYGVSAAKYNAAKGEHVYESTFTPPTRLVYASGEKLDTAGMSFVLTCPICGDKKDVTSEVTLSMETAPAEDSGTYEVTATYGKLTETFKITLVKSETKRLSFNGSSINSSLTASTAENPLFVEPANTVKNYKKVDEIWTETTSNAYGVNDSEGIVRIKANAVIKIHFYRETASFAKISVNAAAYYLMEPAIGKTYPVEFEKLFSSVALNGVKVDIKNGILPGAENWKKTFVDADLCEGNLKAGDNVLELTVSDYYWMSKSSQSESDSNQLYGETDFAIKYIDILAIDYVEKGTATIVFDKRSINAELNEATVENSLFIEPANTVKNYQKVDGSWQETTSNAYGINDSNGIVGIKANAVIKIHFYRETTSYAKISMNAATYYLTSPANGKISPMELPKLFSSIKLNGKDVIVKNDTLPGGEKWISVPADVNLCEGELKTGDNILELTVSDYYWMSGMNASDANYGKQLYNETVFSIKSLSFSLYDYIK